MALRHRTSLHTGRSRVGSRLGIVTVALVLVGATAGTAVGAASGDGVPNNLESGDPRPPTVADDTALIRDPGVVQLPDGQWLVVSTTGAAQTNTSLEGALGDLKPLHRPLVSAVPRLASGSDFWAPSILKQNDYRYVVFFAAPVDRSGTRCIFTGTAGLSELGPGKPGPLFTVHPNEAPLVCAQHPGGVHAPDDVAATTDAPDGGAVSIIDPTPAILPVTEGGVHGMGYFLTYKTEHRNRDGDWHTTQRIVRLSDTTPSSALYGVGTQSYRLTQWTNAAIEENPVMVFDPTSSAAAFTLFTSRGFYGADCTSQGPHPYHTVYRTGDSFFSAGRAAPQPLTVSAKDFTSCGSGNAQVVRAADGGFLVFFNGKYGPPLPSCHNNREACNGQWKGTHFQLYVGRIAHGPKGNWVVTSVLPAQH